MVGLSRRRRDPDDLPAPLADDDLLEWGRSMGGPDGDDDGWETGETEAVPTPVAPAAKAVDPNRRIRVKLRSPTTPEPVEPPASPRPLSRLQQRLQALGADDD